LFSVDGSANSLPKKLIFDLSPFAPVRLSRQGPKLARKTIERIVDNGVEIHIVNINVQLAYGWENDPARSIIVDVELGRAHKESSYKSDRIKASYDIRKASILNGGSAKQETRPAALYTRRVPAWIEVKNGELVLVEEKSGKGRTAKIPVKTVKDVFRLAALGVGAANIARQLKLESDNARSWVYVPCGIGPSSASSR
jgi:hypothetical protein